MRRLSKTDWILTALAYLFATIVHLVAWKYGCLLWELFAGAMFVLGVVAGEGVDYVWWELFLGWYSWPAQVVRAILWR